MKGSHARTTEGKKERNSHRYGGTFALSDVP